MFLGLWICPGIAVTADTLAEHRLVLLCLLVLFSAVPGAVSIAALPVCFSPARHLRNSPSPAVDSDQLGFSGPSGKHNHDIRDSSIE